MHRELSADDLRAHFVDHDFASRDEVRFDQRFRSGEQPDAPFALPIGFFVEVEDFRSADAELSAEVAYQEMRRDRGRDREKTGVHLHAGGNSQDWDSIFRGFGDVSSRSVAAAKQEGRGASADAGVDPSSCIVCGRSFPGWANHFNRLLSNTRPAKRSSSHRPAAGLPSDAEALVVLREFKKRSREELCPWARDRLRTGGLSLVRDSVRPLQPTPAPLPPVRVPAKPAPPTP